MHRIYFKRSAQTLTFIIVALFVWYFFFPHRFQCSTALSLHDAKELSPIPLPATATNIYIAKYRHWIAYGHYVRFEAPIETCVSHIGVVVDYLQKCKKTRKPNLKPREISEEREERFRAYQFQNGLVWFDVTNIQHGVTVGVLDGSWTPQFWIDTNRNIFYHSLRD